jgi:hypothetical protein
MSDSTLRELERQLRSAVEDEATWSKYSSELARLGLKMASKLEVERFLALMWRCDHGRELRFNGSSRWSRKGDACVECGRYA